MEMKNERTLARQAEARQTGMQDKDRMQTAEQQARKIRGFRGESSGSKEKQTGQWRSDARRHGSGGCSGV